MENKVFHVTEAQQFFRLDKFLTDQLPGVSRSQIQSWIKN